MRGVIVIRTGLIYKYTNKINNKSYIGQTIQKLAKRHNRHLKDSEEDNLYFHRALQKYGVDNFTLEILEDNIPLDILDEREKYWIKYYDTFYLNDNGYNMTEGGRWGNAPRKLSDKNIEEIKNLLINTDFILQDIAREYNVSLSCISDINNGRTWYDASLSYPLSSRSVITIPLSINLFEEVIILLKSTSLSYSEIASQLKLHEYTVGTINRGEHSMCKESNEIFPIRKPQQAHTYQNKITQEQVIDIIYDLIFSNLTNKQIGEKYNIHYNTIGDISSGKSWKNITNQFICPIKRNKIKNKEIYLNHYGIV